MKKDIHSNEDFCPVAQVASLLGDTCTLLIVRDLLTGNKRFKELQNSLSPISSRTVTNKLKLLEDHGVIVRNEFKERPPRVEYSLTKNGYRLDAILNEMRIYGKKYLR